LRDATTGSRSRALSLYGAISWLEVPSKVRVAPFSRR
jgi:hypothetical protein